MLMSQAARARPRGRADPRRLPGRILVGVLPAALATILPLAGATLPDVLWIPGIHDGEDVDDLVAETTDGGSLTIAASPLIRAARALQDLSPLRTVRRGSYSALSPRAPPLA
jgi:hypothetical protein